MAVPGVFERNLIGTRPGTPGTRVPGAKMVGEYELLFVGNSEPRGMRQPFHFIKGFLEDIVRNSNQLT